MKTNSTLNMLFESIDRRLKHKSALIFIVVVFLCTSMFGQNSANIIVQPTPITTTFAQTFAVNVRVDFTTGPATSAVDAVEVHFTFDKTKLQVTNITKPASAILPTEAIPLQSISTINSNGQINYAATTNSSFPNADFDFLTITFNTIGGGGTSSPLTYLTTFPNKTDAQRLGSSIVGSISNGTVTIQNCTAPTAVIGTSSASTSCNAQPLGLRLTSATGTSPFSLTVNGTTYNNVTIGQTFATVPFASYKVWPSDPVPANPANNDGGSIEVGVKFRSTTTGFVKTMRFYNGYASPSGTYTGKLWNATTSTLMGSTNATAVSGIGWKEINFTSPIYIAANTTYIISCYSTAGNYAVTDNYFTNAVTNGPITATKDGDFGFNGMFHIGPGIPNTPYSQSNYWVDVIFFQNTNSFNLTNVTDASPCANSGALQTLNVTSVDCSTLPVTLMNLSASPSGKKVTLNWNTSSEMNNKGFDVLRSADGSNWTTIGFVAGVGNSNSITNYTYPDNNLDNGRYYYKLKQIDIDNRSRYSIIVSAVIGSKAEYVLSQNYPNPFTTTTTIQYTLPKAGQVNLSLFDISGRVVRTLVNGSKEAGTHATSLSIGTLSKGVYYYKLQVDDFTDVKKLTIQ